MKSLDKLLLITISVVMIVSCQSASIAISDMKCEYSVHPIFVDNAHPRFNWAYSLDDPKFRQTGYRLYVSRDKSSLSRPFKEIEKDKLVWDSGLVNSDFPSSVYSGASELEPLNEYYWKVVAFDDRKNLVAESQVDSFETAMTRPDQWEGKWISDEHDKDFMPAPIFRKKFHVQERGVRKARLYLSAAAYCRMDINGIRVSNDILNPGFTQYNKRNLYSVLDVTDLLKPGDNVITAVLGNGFYNEILLTGVWDFEKADWRGRARLLSELHILYEDGTLQKVNSDSSWKTTTGPYLQNNIYGGDTYDKRLEPEGWKDAEFDDSLWSQAVVVSPPSEVLSAQKMPGIEVEQELSPVLVTNFGDSVYVYDFGTNFSGFCRLSVKGERGTKVSLHHGEILKPDGRLETGNIDIYFTKNEYTDFQTDIFYLSGDDDVFTPEFTYHGFRYVEIICEKPVKLSQKSLTGLFFHTAVKPVGKFDCSNPLLNDILTASKQSYLCNLMSIPTDCPQREKNGWTGDAHVSMDLGLMNYDGISFYEKWIDDIIDNQREDGRISGIIPSSGWGYEDWIGPVWDAAMFIIPMNLYLYYGDAKSIKAIWPVCRKYLEYLSKREDENGTVTFGLGDWCFFEAQTPSDFTSTCYYWLDNEYMSKFAEILGKDGTAYENKAKKLRDFINDRYFDPVKCIYSSGTQAAQSIPLYLGIAQEKYAQKIADNLSKLLKKNGNMLDFGYLGSKTVLRVLSQFGYADQAYEIAANEDMPSWGYWIRSGLSTLSEKWRLYNSDKDQSLNHVFMGDIGAWMYNDIAGINYDKSKPGFKHILIKPHFVSGLSWAAAEYYSINGLIKSSWKHSGDKIILNVTIPTNTTATVVVGDEMRELEAGEHKIVF